jgi:hypothetical protein
MGKFVTILSSSVHGDLERRPAPTRVKTLEVARDLATECLVGEAERRWLHAETVAIRIEAAPTG